MSEPTVPAFTWHAHPARQQRALAVVGGLIIVAFSGIVAVMMDGLGWGLLAAAILVIPLTRFYFPSRFAIDEHGITVRYPLSRRRIPWTSLRRFICGEHGGLLCTRARRSFLDSWTGVHLLFGEHREDVRIRIAEYLSEQRVA